MLFNVTIIMHFFFFFFFFFFFSLFFFFGLNEIIVGLKFDMKIFFSIKNYIK